MKKSLLATAVMAGLLIQPVVAATITAPIAAAIKDSTRPKTDSDRDALRKSADTLAFSGLKPGMSVVEFFPSGGYYTRLISGVVGPTGKVYGVDNVKWDKGEDAKMAAEPGRSNVTIQLTKFGEFKIDQKVDLVWMTQNYHDLHVSEYGPTNVAAFNKQVHDILKPGGIYFILDHDANKNTSDADINKLHRIEKATVIREVEAAGFKLVGEDKSLNNSTDDHTKNTSDKAIKGHTDQFILKFQKV